MARTRKHRGNKKIGWARKKCKGKKGNALKHCMRRYLKGGK